MSQTKNFKKIYFIGIGGIGMSALARYFKFKGVDVIGSDSDLNSSVVKGLLEEGITVLNQKDIDSYNVLKSIYNADCVIYTLAIPPDNLEMKTAEAHDLPLFTYAEMLGQVSEDNFTIAISGTHGKTTTTAMTAEIAKNLNLKPNVIIGGFLNWEKNKTNFVPGESDLFIVEACEYKRSFLNLHPKILVITNLEADHLDYYKDLEDVQSAFYDLAKKIPADGKIICQKNNPNLKKIVYDFPDKIVDYYEIIEKVPTLQVFGEHNKQNAAAAILAIQNYLYLQKFDVEVKSSKVIDSIKNFKGTWRRMEFKGKAQNGALVYDDYGHHPTEIAVTIKAFRENFPEKKLALIFQPHLYSRTKIFFDEFASVLSTVELSIIYPIYRARAEKDHGVSSELLVQKINEKIQENEKTNTDLPNESKEKNSDEILNKVAEFSDSLDEITEKINSLSDDWIVILLGAGEMYQIADRLKI